VLTCFVDAADGALSPAIATDAVGLLHRIFGRAASPVVLLRPARRLAGGIPVDVKLLAELHGSRA
jgi:hypothetical protein